MPALASVHSSRDLGKKYPVCHGSVVGHVSACFAKHVQSKVFLAKHVQRIPLGIPGYIYIYMFQYCLIFTIYLPCSQSTDTASGAPLIAHSAPVSKARCLVDDLGKGVVIVVWSVTFPQLKNVKVDHQYIYIYI